MSALNFDRPKQHRHVHAEFTTSKVPKGTCSKCGGPTRRSRYGILHKNCARCRYLIMIFGPSITVTRY